RRSGRSSSAGGSRRSSGLLLGRSFFLTFFFSHLFSVNPLRADYEAKISLVVGVSIKLSSRSG
ncbi:hypothetical protein, partial [Candidatus Binatus sp.]|uniref:hypothetical protein n=1 Tax=Candidatus Binatus sp. TaxID=2811406 RepID=UPI003C5C27A8